jgi:type VI secretion system secreted protein VgrG
VNDKLILQVEKSGNTKLFANKLTLDGSDIKFKGSKVQMLGAGSLQSMSKKVQDLENLQEQNPEPNVMKFNLKDESGKTLANQSFEIKLPDGTVKKGKTDGSGNARVEDVPGGQHEISFPGLDGAVQ